MGASELLAKEAIVNRLPHGEEAVYLDSATVFEPEKRVQDARLATLPSVVASGYASLCFY